MQPRAVRQRVEQRQRIGERTRTDSRMIERVDPAAVAREQRPHLVRVQLPQLAERAGGTGKRAVDENQDRGVGRRRIESPDHLGAAALERRRQRVRHQPIQSRVDLAIDFRGDRAGRDIRRAPDDRGLDDLDRLQHDAAHHVAQHAARRCARIESAPIESRWHDESVVERRRCRAGRTERPARGGPGSDLLGANQVARVLRMQVKDRPVGDAEQDDVLARTRAQPLRLAVATPRADPHRTRDRAVQRGTGPANRLRLARDEEGDVCSAV